MNHLPVLTIAGSDSGGGAGIQADLKTFAAIGCYGTSAITAITAQNTLGIQSIFPIPAQTIKEQITAVLDDIHPLAIKIGMIYNSEAVLAITEVLKKYPHIPIIYDPVMNATTGSSLQQIETLAAIEMYLLPIVKLLTPNLDEAAILSSQKVSNFEEMKIAASLILKKQINGAILIKGGHLDNQVLINYYQDQKGVSKSLTSAKIESKNTHGTGCALSSAIVAYLVQGLDIISAIIKATEYVHQAILESTSINIGSGNGPLNHFFNQKNNQN